MEKKSITSKVLWFWFMVVCLSISYADFDYTISDKYYYGTLTLDSESLQITGSGAYSIIATGESYIEADDTLPLYIHTGGVMYTGIYDASIANINGGEFSSIYAYDNSVVNITGGEIRSLDSDGNSNIILSGGAVTYLRISILNLADDWATVTFICDLDSLVIDIMNVEDGIISGNWLDGTSFEMGIIRPEMTLEHINFIPEPTTLGLLGLGGLLIRRKK